MSMMLKTKHLFYSFAVTLFVYLGFIPMMAFEPPEMKTIITIPDAPVRLSLNEASFAALTDIDLGTEEMNEEEVEEPKEEQVETVSKKRASKEATKGQKKTKPLAKNTHLNKINTERKDSESKKKPETTPESDTADSASKKSVTKSKEKIVPAQQIIVKKSKKKRRNRKCRPENPDITRLSSNTYNLPKKLIRHYTKNWDDAYSLAYLGWSRDRKGKIEGVKIRHISCKSPLPFTGLKKGDVITSVNGKSVNSNAKLIRLYTKLFRLKNIELSLIRKGKPMKIKYLVVA